MSELWMGKGKENKRKRVRTGYIKVECLLIEKKGGAFILLVPVGLLYFSFALDLHLCFCWFLDSCWDCIDDNGLQ